MLFIISIFLFELINFKICLFISTTNDNTHVVFEIFF